MKANAKPNTPVSKTALAAALATLTLERRRNLGQLLNLALDNRGRLFTADAEWIARELLAAPMSKRETALKMTAPALKNPDMAPAVEALAKIAFHDMTVIRRVILG